MKKEELLTELNKRNVPQAIYSLDGIKEGECLCIVNEKNTWEVLYNSRGKITYREVFDDVEQAYSRFYQMMKNDYGW